MANNRVLVVDDEPDALGATSRAIRLAGYAVKTASNAKDAIECCEQHSFDIVILDFLMPGVNGLELLTRIRKIQPLVRSIIISGKLEPNATEKDIAGELKQSVQADAYLHKPLTSGVLLNTMSSLLTREPVADWQAIAKDMARASGIKLQEAARASKKLKALKKQKDI
ncbi:MAG: response regulator [Acidobacteria bacterium]|nr:response regulator [Acidobacteriota bacterium]